MKVVELKRLVIISKDLETSQNICGQVKDLVGDRVEVEGYCLEHDVIKDLKDRLVVITSSLIKKHVIPILPSDTDYIIAKRFINCHYLNRLLSIPSGSEVLLVNDHEETCMEAITQLKGLSIDHINYYPFFPGIKDYKRLDVAVTPGEIRLVPSHVKRIIDIGTRQIDITTLVEILSYFGLVEEKGDIIYTQFVRDIIYLSKSFNYAANYFLRSEKVLQAIIENSSDGIIYLDSNGDISAANKIFASIMGMESEKIINKKVDEILPELGEWKVEKVDRDVLKLYGRNQVVTKVPVRKEKNIVGYVITIKDVTGMQKVRYEMGNRRKKQEHSAVYKFGDIISKSHSMKNTIELAKKLATSDSTILIQGESGTGKELFAQSIHNVCRRRNGPFIPVNFAALSANLLESELFGYEEGAFTGAKKGGKRGLFEEAYGGTIFLDEIGDALPELQVSLLRVLQEKLVRRVGGTKMIPVDVRVIAATNKNLKQQVEEGIFRQDLFFRINVLPLHIPPLRERKEDISLLLETYLRKFTNDNIININDFFSKDAFEYLMSYEWMGNVRELVNVIEYLVNVKDSSLIDIKDLPPYITRGFKNSYKSLPAEFQDDNIMWLLKKIKERENAGRRLLATIANKEGRELSEANIRSLMKVMEKKGLIIINKGIKGTTITEKGMELLLTLKWDKR